jgi:inner membrane protein involved in colicin E2 resistance
MDNKKIYEKTRIFSLDILLNILMFSILGFVIAVMFFSFNYVAYTLLTGGGTLLGLIVGVIKGKREADQIASDQKKNENT